jgi:hypothetical protein
MFYSLEFFRVNVLLFLFTLVFHGLLYVSFLPLVPVLLFVVFCFNLSELVSSLVIVGFVLPCFSGLYHLRGLHLNVDLNGEK